MRHPPLPPQVVPGVTESLKVMTRDATRRIAHYAFEYAFLNNRSKVTAVHKVGLCGVGGVVPFGMSKRGWLFMTGCAGVPRAGGHATLDVTAWPS